MLKYRIYRSLVWRQVAYSLSLKQNCAFGYFLESRYDPEQSGLPAPGWPEQSEKLVVLDLEIDFFQRDEIAVFFENALQFDRQILFAAFQTARPPMLRPPDPRRRMNR